MSDFRFSPRPNKAEQINWREWGESAFQEAQQEDKPILLSLSAVWCHWCHVMDETSYSDEENINLINASFIPIRVDNDQRPDINQRYNLGGWPTTAFLTSEGDVLTGGTYIEPITLRTLLAQVKDFYRHNKGAIRQKATEIRVKKVSAVKGTSKTSLPNTLVDDVVRAVSSRFDSIYGGFGDAPKFPMPESVDLLLNQHQVKGELRYLLMATKTLDQMRARGIFDQVEGGFFRYSTTQNWEIPHYEKMLEGNLGLLTNYLRAFRISGEESYHETAQRIMGYLEATLHDQKAGAFYGSQDADEEYYGLSLEGRKDRTPPAVDRTFYTNWNAMAASAYLEAYWTLGQEEALEMALSALEFLWDFCRDEKEGMFHYRNEKGSHLLGLLTDQVYAVSALLDAYEVTGRSVYLGRALALSEIILSRFRDSQGGGFFDIVEGESASGGLGNLKIRDKSLSENAAAARVFTCLFRLTGNEKYREAARSALEAFAGDYQAYGDFAAGYALAYTHFAEEPLQITVVGSPDDPKTKQLIAAALKLPHPFRAVQTVDPEADQERLDELGYPPSPSPAAYVCFDTACSAPVVNDDALAKAAEGIMKAQKRLTLDLLSGNMREQEN